jgi:hypothetical protein
MQKGSDVKRQVQKGRVSAKKQGECKKAGWVQKGKRQGHCKKTKGSMDAKRQDFQKRKLQFDSYNVDLFVTH